MNNLRNLMSKMIDNHEIVPKCLSEYHTFSNVEFQKHSRIDNKPMYMKILTVWALTSEKNLQIQFPGSQMYSTRLRPDQGLLKYNFMLENFAFA